MEQQHEQVCSEYTVVSEVKFWEDHSTRNYSNPGAMKQEHLPVKRPSHDLKMVESASIAECTKKRFGILLKFATLMKVRCQTQHPDF